MMLSRDSPPETRKRTSGKNEVNEHSEIIEKILSAQQVEITLKAPLVAPVTVEMGKKID